MSNSKQRLNKNPWSDEGIEEAELLCFTNSEKGIWCRIKCTDLANARSVYFALHIDTADIISMKNWIDQFPLIRKLKEEGVYDK